VTRGDLEQAHEHVDQLVAEGARVEGPGKTDDTARGLATERTGLKLTGAILAFLVALGLTESILAALFTARRKSEGVRARSLDFAMGTDSEMKRRASG